MVASSVYFLFVSFLDFEPWKALIHNLNQKKCLTGRRLDLSDALEGRMDALSVVPNLGCGSKQKNFIAEPGIQDKQAH